MPKVPQRAHKSTLQKKRPPLKTKRTTIPRRRVIRRKRKQKPMSRTTFTALLCLCIGICFAIVIINMLASSHKQVPGGPYTLEGNPTISADFINNVLAHYDSPASGKGQALYDDGVKYDIDPAY